MYFNDNISAGVALIFILYGVSGVVPLVAAIYLLFRRGNAFAADIKPPLRLRRWAASFFIAALLSHVWWLLLYFFSDKYLSAGHVAIVVFDGVTLLTTITGTLLAMLQDRRRPVWPAPVVMIPFALLAVAFVITSSPDIMRIAIAYFLAVFVGLTIYMLFAIRQYSRWLYDNYADLEHKRIWLSQSLILVVLLLFIVYGLDDGTPVISYTLAVSELLLFGGLLWRIETLPLLKQPSAAEQPATSASGVDFSAVERLLAERCVATRLYLQHDLTLAQLARALNTNRTYLGQYFSNSGTNYNTYINDLRITYFVNSYREAVSKCQPVTAKQLAIESGYHSYSTFSLAFKQRMGCNVTTWMHEQ